MFDKESLARIQASVHYTEAQNKLRPGDPGYYRSPTSHILVGIVSSTIGANGHGAVGEQYLDDDDTWVNTGNSFVVWNYFNVAIGVGVKVIFGKVGRAWVAISIEC